MNLKKCLNHDLPEYTLKSTCPKCKKPSIDAHYKFIKIKSANSEEFKS